MYDFFNPNSIKPKGWLLNQLKIQSEGLSGNLDKIWPDIADSAWFGGEHESWERVPYWLDGYIPMAFLLDDNEMIANAKKRIKCILKKQQSDGWICPCEKSERQSYDIWAFFLIGKVLAMYCEFTNDKAAESGLYKAMKCLYLSLKSGEIHLFDWGKFRWFECIIPLQFLKDRYSEPWITELGKMLRDGGADYNEFTESWKNPLDKWTFHTHIVNIAMMFKYEAVCCKFFGEKYSDNAENLWRFLEKYNGTAVGSFSGDECLSGIRNNRGTELCSIVELMYSLETLYSVTHKAIWADRLEKLAFNALPATFTDDMWAHQYDQMVNQIACVRFPGKSFFRTNTSDAHLFGLEPNFGCCTANFSQGWPKFIMSAFMKTNNGIECAVSVPSELSTKINGTNVKITTITEYPFENCCKYKIEAENPVKFEFKIRIPRWCKSYTLNGETFKARHNIVTTKYWQNTETITVVFNREISFVKRPMGLKTLELGPLVFSLPVVPQYTMLEYEKDGVERKFPYCDYELMPQSEWQYGFFDENFKVSIRHIDGTPFSSKNPPITIEANLCRINWSFEDGYESVANYIPAAKKPLKQPQSLTLVPYGCAKLRMTEMPLIK